MLQKEPPGLYFRLREPGATVFRLHTGSQGGRMQMEAIALANLRNGEIKVQGTGPDATERAEIEAWIAHRREGAEGRDNERFNALIEQLNGSAHWIGSRAGQQPVMQNATALLLALHDLRTTIVRRMTEQSALED